MSDSTDEVALILHSTTDAQVWAREFMRIFEGATVTNDGTVQTPSGTWLSGSSVRAVDEGTMIGWFANAIEVGRSAGFNDAREL